MVEIDSLLPANSAEIKSAVYAALAGLLMWAVRELQYRQRLRQAKKRRRFIQNLERYSKEDTERVHQGENVAGQSKGGESRPGEDSSGGGRRTSIFED